MDIEIESGALAGVAEIEITARQRELIALGGATGCDFT